MSANFWEYSKEYHETRVLIETLADEQLMLAQRHGFIAENPHLESLQDEADASFQRGRRLESERKPHAASRHFLVVREALDGFRIETRREYAAHWSELAWQTLTLAGQPGTLEGALDAYDRARAAYHEARALTNSETAGVESIIDIYDRACNYALSSIRRSNDKPPLLSTRRSRGTFIPGLFVTLLVIGFLGSCGP